MVLRGVTGSLCLSSQCAHIDHISRFRLVLLTCLFYLASGEGAAELGLVHTVTLNLVTVSFI